MFDTSIEPNDTPILRRSTAPAVPVTTTASRLIAETDIWKSTTVGSPAVTVISWLIEA